MEIYQKLQEKLGDLLRENVELKQYSTFKLGGPAKYFFIAKTREEIIKAAQAARELSLPFFILGGGSNILISDQGFGGLVIKAENRGVEVRKNIIRAEAGASLRQVVTQAMENGLSGLEWASGIPGTVGGAVRGNCGAYGDETAGIIRKVDVFNIETGRVKNFSPEACQFSYRESIFKKGQNFIILGAEFELKPGNKEEIKNKMLEYKEARTSSQPKFPSLGCNFKNIIATDEIKEKVMKVNPDGLGKIKGGKIGAAWFIDQTDLKGYQIGGAKVSDEHANFIIKCSEEGKADDVAQLISYIKQQVRDKFGIQLQEELQYVGFN